MDETYYQQHPIPQQISSYEFRLVGDMTIKQFFQVAGGALIALFIYSSSLPNYFKVPLIVVSVLLGLALAFFPLQDRPLSQWIVLFIKSIYSPTLFIWGRVTPKPDYFQKDEPLTIGSQTPVAPKLTPIEQARAQIQTPRPEVKVPGVNTPVIPQHKGEEVAKTAETPPPQPIPEKVEKQQIDQPAEFARLEKSEEEFLSKVAAQFTAIAQDFKTPVVHVVNSPQVEAQRPNIKVPEVQNISVEKAAKPTVVASPELKSQPPATPPSGYNVSPSMGEKPQNTVSAQFATEGTPPAPPSLPNIIVGQIVDSAGKIVEGAILEIRDGEGRPVRALRTNKLGHFMIATPLLNGEYTLLTEKDGFVFDSVKIDVKGEIIQPIAIRAKQQ